MGACLWSNQYDLGGGSNLANDRTVRVMGREILRACDYIYAQHLDNIRNLLYTVAIYGRESSDSVIYGISTLPPISTVTHPATLQPKGNQDGFGLTRAESFPLDNGTKHSATMT